MSDESLSTQVNETLVACLFRDGEGGTDGAVLAEGVQLRLGFHPGRLAENRGRIREFLTEMAPQFHRSSGGGWSFLNLCTDRRGDLWTGSHRTVDELVCLGLATGMVEFCLPRELWPALPGAMPYLVIDVERGAS